MKIFKIILTVFNLMICSCVQAENLENENKSRSSISQPIIYLQPNTTQLFTELYQAYGILNPIRKTFFEDALYLDQSTPNTIFPFQPSNQNIFDYASKILEDFHRRMGDLELYIDPSKAKPFFYLGSGSKHLIVALVYGMVMSEPDKKFVFAQRAPYYSGHPNAVTGIFKYPNARYVTFEDVSEIKLEPGEVLVEFVTSPNNPDGKFRKPSTNAQIIIADLVFASSTFGSDGKGYLAENLEWIKQARLSGKHVFSFNSASKQFGKTGSRCGYIWYPIYDPYAALIFKNFFTFLSASTVGAGTTGLAEFLDLIQALIDLPDAGKAMRKDGNTSLVMRHRLVEQEILAKYPKSIVLSIPGSPTFFAKIVDARIPGKKASDVLLEDFNVAVNSGDTMGESSEFIRLNLSGYSQILIEFLNRMSASKKYTLEDVLSLSTQKCSSHQISSQDSKTAIHVVSPRDCILNADAQKGSIDVVLPPFIDYDLSRTITIMKTDSSPYPVKIKSDQFLKILNKGGDNLKVQWTQPLYFDGRWQIIETEKR